MLTLAFGLVLFVSVHMLREFGLRDAIKQRLGATRYYVAIVTSVVTAIVLIVVGKSTSSFIQIWTPPFHWRVYTDLLMFSACVFFLAGFLPLSHSRYQLKHPALIGVLIWGGAHLLANGDLASILIFASLSIWATTKIISLNLATHKTKQNQASRPALHWDFAAIVLGFFMYSLLLIFHGQLFGFALVDIV